MNLTSEQNDIVATDVPRGQTLKITAFAGCAKTTTLREYAVKRPNERFLYLAFNTSVAAEARESFPPNVTAKTTHSLAYGKFGYKYKDKLGFLKPYILTDHLKVEGYPVAKYLIDVVVKYLASSDEEISDKHLNLDRDKTQDEYVASKDEATRKFLLKKANELWTAMKDTKNHDIPMIHDGYLKLFQLSKPQLPFDYVLLDEGHDTNDVTLDIFSTQQCSKILVGDSHQSIYEFRHAYDALGLTKANIDKYLSISFRFGPTIAGLANMLLGSMKGEKVLLKGYQDADTIGCVNQNQPFTTVSRTNGELFNVAVELLKKNRKFGFIGTNEKDNFSPYKSYFFDRIMDVYYLFAGEKHKIKDIYIKRFPTFGAFMSVIQDKDAPDAELMARASVVTNHRYDVPRLVDQVVRNSVNPAQAHYLFTTAHRSKGLEWNQVMLTNDYEDMVIKDEATDKRRIATFDDINPQEINLLYVAATRAKKTLQINDSLCELQDFLEQR